MLYKIKNGLIDIDSHQYIQSNDSRTRGKDRLYQERMSSEAFGNSVVLLLLPSYEPDSHVNV
jgi:hypothetical protein